MSGGIATPKLRDAQPLDVEAMENQIDKTGRASLVIAGEVMEAELFERDIYGEHGRKIYITEHHKEPVLSGYVTARNFVGKVVGEDDGIVYMTTDQGTNAIYGIVYLRGHAYDIVTEREPGEPALLVTYWNALPRAPPLGELSLGVASASKSTTIRASADSEFRATHSDWSTRISSAFNLAHTMWDRDTDIHQLAGPFEAITSFYTGTNVCGDMLAEYRQHVGAEISIGWYTEDHFVLFIGQDNGHDGCAYYAPAGASPITMGSEWSSSLTEAVDNNPTDQYDPDVSHHFGILSAGEIGHVYGEEDHQYTKRCEERLAGICIEETYNVMAMGSDPDEMAFWFTVTSMDRIKSESWPQL